MLRPATALPCLLGILLAASTAASAGAPAPADHHVHHAHPAHARHQRHDTGVLERFAVPAEGIHAGGRISAAELPALHAAGIAQVIDLTPDAETPDFDEAAAVRAAGMAYANLPIAGPTDLTPEAVAAFDRLLRNAQGPVLVHCASGNRVGALAALRAALVGGQSDEDAIAEGRRWGLGSLEGPVRARLARERCLAMADGGAAAKRCAAGG